MAGGEREPRPTVLIVTDDEAEGARLAARLAVGHITPIRVSSREAAVNVIDSTPLTGLVLRLSGSRMAGLHLLALARERNPEAGGILIIEPGEEARASRALQRGAIDFQARPVNEEKVVALLAQLHAHHVRAARLARTERRLDERFGFTGLIGESTAMMQLLGRLKEIAPREAAVLIVGDPGTGKTLTAQVIHQNSPRRNALLVSLACDALPGRALEQELFGRRPRRGGRRVRGRLELAAEGTLLLEEIVALPRPLQERLADALRRRQVRPGLDAPPIEVDPRLLATSAQDPADAVDAGTLDEGLYRLLRETRLDLLPLRHRRGDIGALARHFIREAETGHTLGRAVIDRLMRYDWPGNVRELRAVMADLVATAGERRRLEVSDLPETIRAREGLPGRLALRTGVTLEEAERILIRETLRHTGGNREQAARLLGIGLRTLYRKLTSMRKLESDLGPPRE